MVINIIIDTETTSLDEKMGQVISIGWAFKINKVLKSGNILIRPNMDRINQQDKYELNEALAVNKMTLEEIMAHPVEYQNALPLMLERIKNDIKDAGHHLVNCSWRFLAYNYEFDMKFISCMPHSHLVIPHMPRYVSNNDFHTCCIMLRASERWGEYSEYWGNHQWVRLVDAYSFAGEYSGIEIIPHNSEYDSIMALRVHEVLTDGE